LLPAIGVGGQEDEGERDNQEPRPAGAGSTQTILLALLAGVVLAAIVIVFVSRRALGSRGRDD
jgi:hypothetical protein